MFKKITLSVATLVLSAGLFSTSAGAEEVVQPSSPIQNPNQVESSVTVEPFAAQVYVTRYAYYIKSEYPLASGTPKYLSVTEMINNSPYGGNLSKVNVEPYGLDWWKVEYSGYLTKFEM
ncbi:hypothetical protein GY31_06050 [Lysinibacillus sphaericus]|uniref:hypothetical protein n=1 Tax=Lysinibacillus TaxID=400634 RepID=UPI00084A73C6|nr:hypothetical protein [Lysinibacillus sphaericus]OEC02601.1 hypothetical protein GY31_06050 [Lysinibacillus sphaericus]